MVVSFSFKNDFMISSDRLFNILYIIVGSICIFLPCTVTDLPLEKISSNDEKLSLETILNALS